MCVNKNCGKLSVCLLLNGNQLPICYDFEQYFDWLDDLIMKSKVNNHRLISARVSLEFVQRTTVLIIYSPASYVAYLWSPFTEPYYFLSLTWPLCSYSLNVLGQIINLALIVLTFAHLKISYSTDWLWVRDQKYLAQQVELYKRDNLLMLVGWTPWMRTRRTQTSRRKRKLSAHPTDLRGCVRKSSSVCHWKVHRHKIRRQLIETSHCEKSWVYFPPSSL